MSIGLDNLGTRLSYQGGAVAEDRMVRDKLRSLRRAMVYSYQGATAILEDGREFRCLINDDKLKEDYTQKIISIPYRDVCLNKERVGTTGEGQEDIGMKPGDVFEWKETESHWLVYMEYLEEYAYFRGEILLCEEQAEIDGHSYWIYVRGPTETTIQWNQKHNIVWNDINYSLIAYITQNEETLAYFHRFTTIKIGGKTWEVKAINSYYGDGIIKICLGEWFENEMKEAQILPTPATPPDPDSLEVYIDGLSIVSPFDILNYKIVNLYQGTGEWVVSNSKARILEQTGEEVKIEVMTSKSGNFTLSYVLGNTEICTLDVLIQSL